MKYHDISKLGISKLDLKRRNRMQILKVIREQGAISRVDIASTLKITRAAVTIITNEMIEEGIIYEVGEAPVSLEVLQKGRRKILIDIKPDFKYAVGVSINDSSVSIGISNLKNNVIDKSLMRVTSETTFDGIIDFIVNETCTLLKRNNFEHSKILGLGISIQPELCGKMKVYFKDGKLDFTFLSETIEKKLDLSVTCMNSISALALTNQEINIDDRPGNYIFIQFGNTINMSVLLENEVMHEYVNHTNQIERTICRPNGTKLSGFPDGSVKAELTRNAVVAKYAAILSKKDTPIFWEATNGKVENINHKTVSIAASRGEKKVLEVLDEVFKMVMLLINNFSVVLFARYIILHNFHMNEWLFNYLKKMVSENCGDDLANKIRISRTEDSLEFMSGCAISVYEHFYNTGGQ